MPEDFRLGLLDQVWQELRDRYVDPTMHGLDWDAVHDDFAERMLITFDAHEAYQNISDMVALLEDPDTAFVSVLDLEASAIDPTYGGVGILVDSTAAQDTASGLRVVYVFPGSPALAAGIQPRDVILAVEGDPCARPELIRGPVGTKVSLLVRSPGQEPRTVEVERQRIAPVYQVEPQRVPGRPRYGYLRLVSLAGDAADQVEGALAHLLDQGDLAGLVLDLRHASAGDLEVTRRILGSFVGGEVATQRTRDGDTPFVVEAGPLRDRLRDVPVAVLVDAATDGEGERLAAILQAERDAVVVGQATPGHTQVVAQQQLPEGSLLQMVIGGMLLSDGTRLEGHGVIPDIVREDDWLTQPAEQDQWVLDAVRELRRASPPSAAPE
jgi:carboxyl-terminal processing protease